MARLQTCHTELVIVSLLFLQKTWPVMLCFERDVTPVVLLVLVIE